MDGAMDQDLMSEVWLQQSWIHDWQRCWIVSLMHLSITFSHLVMLVRGW
jgi:hypothetical protein